MVEGAVAAHIPSSAAHPCCACQPRRRDAAATTSSEGGTIMGEAVRASRLSTRTYKLQEGRGETMSFRLQVSTEERVWTGHQLAQVHKYARRQPTQRLADWLQEQEQTA
ncbi:hypothetical protein Vretifemale_377, partial [Volvox reticuliferus]